MSGDVGDWGGRSWRLGLVRYIGAMEQSREEGSVEHALKTMG